ncbi:MAG: hypothetical protein IT169_11755 [Bryobacterales bacterium]|nr:hypothetical protein [Bryobacterales bacterium]
MRRNTVLLWLLIVFVSGSAVGAAGYRYFAAPEDAPREDRKPPSREQIRQEYRAKLRERVGVSEEQLAQITSILDEAKSASDAKRGAFEAELREIQNQTRERMRAVMTDEQRSRYDAWREERRREREKHDQARQKKENEKTR